MHSRQLSFLTFISGCLSFSKCFLSATYFYGFYSSTWPWILLLPLNNQTLDIIVMGKAALHTHKNSIKKCPNLPTVLPHSNIQNTAVKELWCFDDVWQALIGFIMKSALGPVFTSLSPKFTRVRSLFWQSSHFMQISVNENLLQIHSPINTSVSC